MIYDSSGSVTTAGTPVPLLSVTTMADWVEIIPLGTNAGPIYIGGSAVKNLGQGPSGDILNVGDKAFYPPIASIPLAPMPYNLNKMYANADNSGDGFALLYGRRG